MLQLVASLVLCISACINQKSLCTFINIYIVPVVITGLGTQQPNLICQSQYKYGMIPLYNDTSVIRTHTCTVHLQVSKPQLSKYLDYRNRETASNGTGGLIYINKELFLHLYLGLQIMFLSPWQHNIINVYMQL